MAKALVRPGAAGGAPCISADVPLGAEGATVVGSFTVEGLTFAVRPTLVAQLLAEGGVPSAEDGAGSDAAGWAPAEAARVADGGLQVELVGVVPGALAARGTDGLAAATAGEASSATLALPESIVYQGVGYSVTSIDADAFAGCAVQEVVLPAFLTEVDPGAFRGSAVEAVAVADGNAVFASYDGALYSADMTRILLVPEGRSGQLRISSLTEEAAPQAFSHCALVEAFSVDAGCPGFSSENGFLYDAAGEVLVAAPGEAAQATALLSNDGEGGNVEGDEGEAEGALTPAGRLRAEGPATAQGGAAAVAPEGADATPAATLDKAATATADSWTLTVDCGEGGAELLYADWTHAENIKGRKTLYSVKEVRQGTKDWYVVTCTDGTIWNVRLRVELAPIGYDPCEWNVSADQRTMTAVWKPYLKASTDRGTLTLLDGGWKVLESGKASYKLQCLQELKVETGFLNIKLEEDRRNITGHCTGYWYDSWTEIEKNHWKPDWKISVYHIVYSLAGGAMVEPGRDYTIESPTFSLPLPSRAGYAFAGWTVAGAQGAGVEEAGTTTTIKQGTYGNLTATARWTPVAYSIGYNLDGGELSGQPTSYDTESLDFALPAPIRAGYSFLGWTVRGAAGAGVVTSGTTTTIRQGTYGNLTATARWGSPYSATIDAGGGAMRLYSDYGTNAEWLLEEGIASRVIQWDSYQAIYGSEGSRCVHWPLGGQRRALYVDRTGYTFMGWSVVEPDGSTAVIDGSMGGQPLIPGATYTALWDPYIKASTEHGSLTLRDGDWNELESGKGELTLRSLKEVKVETAMQPSFLNVRVADGSRNIFAFRDGYTCMNWTEKEANHYAPVWSPVPYSIAYELDGGELSGQPTSYDIESLDFALPTPTRYGYVFAGWTVAGAQGAGVEEAGTTTTIRQGTYGNLTATARWTLRYDLDVPVVEPGDVTFEADSVTGDVRVAQGSSATGALLSYMAVPVALDALACEGLGDGGAPAAGDALEVEEIFGQGAAAKVSFTATFGGDVAAHVATVQVGTTASLAPLAIPAAASKQAPGRLAVTYGLELDAGLPIPPVRDAAPVARLVYTVALPSAGA